MIVCIGDAVSRRNREGNHFSTYDAVSRRDRALHSDSILQKLISTLCTCQTLKKDHVSSDEMTRQRFLTDAIFLISYIVLSCVMTRVILKKKLSHCHHIMHRSSRYIIQSIWKWKIIVSSIQRTVNVRTEMIHEMRSVRYSKDRYARSKIISYDRSTTNNLESQKLKWLQQIVWILSKYYFT